MLPCYCCTRTNISAVSGWLYVHHWYKFRSCFCCIFKFYHWKYMQGIIKQNGVFEKQESSPVASIYACFVTERVLFNLPFCKVHHAVYIVHNARCALKGYYRLKMTVCRNLIDVICFLFRWKDSWCFKRTLHQLHLITRRLMFFNSILSNNSTSSFWVTKCSACCNRCQTKQTVASAYVSPRRTHHSEGRGGRGAQSLWGSQTAAKEFTAMKGSNRKNTKARVRGRKNLACGELGVFKYWRI